MGDRLLQKHLLATDVNWIYYPELTKPLYCTAKIRYSHNPAPCIVQPHQKNMVEVVFTEPVRAITRGQSVVFYQDDYVLGGGVIATQGIAAKQ